MLAGTEEKLPAGSGLTRSVRVLLDSLIDFAGLFPPASLSMAEAVRRYESYRESEHAWILGRFVVPAAQLGDVPIEIPVTVLAGPDEFPDVDVVETKASTAADVEHIARNRGGRTIYVEIADDSLVDALARHGLRAKVRTGGVTADAFPSVQRLARFIQRCAEARVPFKATAGLHHPLHCVKPLTYESNSPTATMHGFLNVFLSAALPQFAEKILFEENPRAFAFDNAGAWWRDRRITVEELTRVRTQVAISFGSCSFEEPVADLKEIGWL
jgi:hypothetical protein